jgi:hypothetical protein
MKSTSMLCGIGLICDISRSGALMNGVLTVQMLNRCVLYMVSQLPRSEHDGLFALTLDIKIPSFELASPIDHVLAKYLSPALLAAWKGPWQTPPASPYGLPSDAQGTVERAGGFVGRCIRYCRMHPDECRTRFDICTDPAGDLH